MTPEFAIDEVYDLVNKRRALGEADTRRIPIERFLCALFAELAYYHIPEWEIDYNKRVKLIPCRAYRSLVVARVTNLVDTLPIGDFIRFSVADAGVVVVGAQVHDLLFIGFRGTQFLFDWRANLRSKLVPVIWDQHMHFNFVIGRMHAGFCEEAARISTRIHDAVSDFNGIKHVFLTGHSLGGAVAAISDNYLSIAPSSVCLFGSPRYADVSTYLTRRGGFPVQVRRVGDQVPTIPPRFFGYADHPYEFDTNGKEYINFSPYLSSRASCARWIQFLMGGFKSHDMERYRQDLGITAGAQGASLPLTAYERLASRDIKS